ncbi:hypothetical protein PPYR_02921 [Photinus pyralis]|uniref:Major facilitator superfamily (MFS) profile domain-containing protein n=2 Tax=Photinus pyralis TaxID=7054 RepID=A0A5N4A1F0_PHOPY|nr:facilitated trehalose transporter Tret1-like [Photinus pyralis]XP_031331687.1 facilitated trehalose transporter Tret1-like [Photinus pyralis]KAB0791121.1 hypothetical protein PPYR_02921 [Photinus pyralis]
MGEIVQKLQRLFKHGTGRTMLAAICAHSVSISIGMCQGYSAILLPQLARDFQITSEESSWIASLGAVTNPIGSILSGLLAEYLGHKPSILLSSLPSVIGWICIATATNINLMYAGRLVTGIAAGMSVASYTYVAEISAPSDRGLFQSLGPICASFGILITYVLGAYVRWNVVALVSVAFSIFTVIGMQLVPESPDYLLKKGKKDKAAKSLLWFRRSNTEVVRFNSDSEKATRKLYLTSTVMKPFFILVTLFLLQALSGIYTILYYAVNFFEEANLNIDEHMSSIIVGLIRFTMSVAAAFLINRFGRRTLCIVSSGGMTVTMLAAGGYFKYYEVFIDEEKRFRALPLVGVLCNVFFSMIGMLPIPWILAGELFPLRVSSIMGGVVICLAQTFTFVCVKIYYDMIALLHFSGTLMLFCFVSLLALLFCTFVLPETKDKSLDDIETIFKKKTEINPEVYTVTLT